MRYAEVSIGHGFAHGGAWRTALWLRPWCGRDELFLREECSGAPPAARATALLARCAGLHGGSRPAGAELVRALTVGDREALLLHLWRITRGGRMACVLTCPACRGRLDLDLDAGALLAPGPPPSGREHEASFEIGRERFDVRFRLPSGADQEDLASLAARDEDAAEREALRRCVAEIRRAGEPLPEVPEAAVARISELMAEADPQAEMVLEAVCPECGASIHAPFDAAQFVLRSIEQGAETLDREIHLLAWHYHWSESAILRMSARRRRRYLELIADSMGERRRP